MIPQAAQVPGISAFPDGDNLFNWVGTIQGPAETPYKGLSYKIQMNFPSDYPFSAPTIFFDTPIFHPNVDINGAICLDILKVFLTMFRYLKYLQDKWSAVYNIQTILLSLQSLLGGILVGSCEIFGS